MPVYRKVQGHLGSLSKGIKMEPIKDNRRDLHLRVDSKLARWATDLAYAQNLSVSQVTEHAFRLLAAALTNEPENEPMETAVRDACTTVAEHQGGGRKRGAS